MKVLVVGGGGREHALIRKIKESPKVTEIACCPGNGGISYDAECYPVSATDIDGVVELAKQIRADLVVVAPDDPLVMGMVDALNQAGFKTFGPNARAAIIEGSKVFSKNLMLKYNIPTAEYKVFDNPADVISYIKEKNEFPTVIKALSFPKTWKRLKRALRRSWRIRFSVKAAITLLWRNTSQVPKFPCWRLRTANVLNLWCLPWITSALWMEIRV